MTTSMRVSPSPESLRRAADAQISHVDAVKYWTSISPDVNGMLGGYPHISRIDLQGSSNFLAKLARRRRPQSQQQSKSISRQTRSTNTNTPLFERAVDCGAGIGRITHGLLLHNAHTVDIVEPIQHFTAEISTGAKFSAFRNPTNPNAPRIGEIYNTGLESWTPSHSYDLIWNQWCLGQLKDAQLISYFRQCQKWLTDGGWIVIKENLSTEVDGSDLFDELDSSVTRSETNWERLFEEAGLRVVVSELQRGFPKGLYPVRTWALQPKDNCRAESIG